MKILPWSKNLLHYYAFLLPIYVSVRIVLYFGVLGKIADFLLSEPGLNIIEYYFEYYSIWFLAE